MLPWDWSITQQEGCNIDLRSRAYDRFHFSASNCLIANRVDTYVTPNGQRVAVAAREHSSKSALPFIHRFQTSRIVEMCSCIP